MRLVLPAVEGNAQRHHFCAEEGQTMLPCFFISNVLIYLPALPAVHAPPAVPASPAVYALPAVHAAQTLPALPAMHAAHSLPTPPAVPAVLMQAGCLALQLTPQCLASGATPWEGMDPRRHWMLQRSRAW